MQELVLCTARGRAEAFSARRLLHKPSRRSSNAAGRPGRKARAAAFAGRGPWPPAPCPGLHGTVSWHCGSSMALFPCCTVRSSDSSDSAGSLPAPSCTVRPWPPAPYAFQIAQACACSVEAGRRPHSDRARLQRSRRARTAARGGTTGRAEGQRSPISPTLPRAQNSREREGAFCPRPGRLAPGRRLKTRRADSGPRGSGARGRCRALPLAGPVTPGSGGGVPHAPAPGLGFEIPLPPSRIPAFLENQ